MAEKDQDRVPTPSSGFVPFDDLVKQQGITPPAAESGFVTLDAVKKDLPKPEPPKPASHPEADNMHAANRQVAGHQFTHPDTDKYSKENDLGQGYDQYGQPVYWQGKDAAGKKINHDPDSDLFYKDEKGDLTRTHTNRHVTLWDEETGKMKVYKRSEDTDYGPISGRLFGLGALLGDSLHMSPVTSMIGGGANVVTKLNRAGKEVVDVDKTVPGTRIPLTAKQEALEAADKIKEATAGPKPPSPKGFADTWSFFGERKPPAGGVEVPISNAQVAGAVEGKAGAAVSHIPGGHKPFVDAAARTQEGFEQAAQAASSSASKSSPVAVADAGDTAKTAITHYIAPSSDGGKLATQVDKAYAKVDPLISPTATQPLTETMKAATQIQKDFAATKRPGLSPIVQQIAHAVTDPAGLTYKGIKDLRSEIGDAIGKGSFRDKMLSNLEVGDLKRIYGGLTDDLRNLIQASGGKRAVGLWEKANTVAGDRAEKVKQLATIIGSETRSEEKIYQTVINMAGSTSTADIKKLALARKAMGAVAWRDVSSAAINELGYVRTGNAREFSIDKFMKDYGKFSDAGKNIVFGEGTPHRIALDNLVKIGESWPNMKSVTSPSGEITHLLSFGALFHHFEKALAVMGVSKVAGTVLARPITADGAARWLQSYKVFSTTPTRANAEIFTQATRRLGEDLAKGDESYTNKGAGKVGDFTNYIMDKTGVSSWWQGRKDKVSI